MVNKKFFSKKANISYFEILTLIVASFAFCYIIYESEQPVNKINSQIDNIQNNPLITFFEFILSKISAPLFPLVSAESSVCCEQAKNGLSCFDGLASDCNSAFTIAPSICSQTSFCKPGCCVDENEGTYDKNVPQLSCTGLNKTWKDDANCNFADASFGCCVLGKNTQFVTSQRCTRLASQTGVSKDWRASVNELQCVALSAIKIEGACVSVVGNQKTCKIMTLPECKALTGYDQNWNKGLLCTAPALNTTCKRTKMTSCFSSQDEVYYLDSCGNKANIYDSSKINDVSYWTNIMAKNSSCNSNSQTGNADSKSCGNCNRFNGGICSFVNISGTKPTYGNYYCKSTDCTFKNAAGVTRTYKNGESWCDFDAKIGNGEDLPGSRHFKYICSQGEVQVEPCADARNEICVEQTLTASAKTTNIGNQTNTTITIDTTTDGTGFANAACRVNNWRECVSSDKGAKASALDCMLADVKYDTFEVSLAVPKYPEGFEVGSDSGSDICAKASAKCTVKFKSTKDGECKCVENCECLTGQFDEDMNNICTKLGDCGSKPGIATAKPIDGQRVDAGTPEQMQKFLVAAGIIPGSSGETEKDKGNTGMGSLLTWGLGGGAVGLGGVAMWAMNSVGLISDVAATTASGMSISLVPTFSLASITAFAGPAIIGFGIGFIAGSFLAPMFGIKDPTGQLLFSLGVGAAGASLATLGVMAYEGTITSSFSALASLEVSMAAFAAAFVVVAAIAAVVLIALSFLFKGGKKKTCAPQTVSFTCSQWRPPAGGANCNKCNDNPMKPCSEYRCKSLGAACNLINAGTSDEICVNGAADDTSQPDIDTRSAYSSSNAKITNVDNNGFTIESINKTCMDAYDYMIIGFNTTKPAQCKYDVQDNNFDNMTNYFGSNNYVSNHLIAMSLPDPNAILNTYFENDGTTASSLTDNSVPLLNANGAIKFYVRCKDYTGLETSMKTINTCVDPGQDYKEPKVTAALPTNKGSISFNATKQEFAIFTNEPSECKWSFNDKDYDSMEVMMNCVTDISSPSLLGYQCSATLPINQTTTTIFIRCKDQPWLTGEGRNVNTASYVYSLSKLSDQITIDSIEPNTDIQTGTQTTTIEIKVQTSGGAPNPVCSYSFLGYDNMIQFFNTYSNTHTQQLNLQAGSYNLYIQCVDSTGDKVNNRQYFTINYDPTPPLITRAFQENGKIEIFTNKESDCRYSIDTCDFDFTSGLQMTANILGKEHITNGLNSIYYIKCRDKYGNMPDSNSCSIVFHSVE